MGERRQIYGWLTPSSKVDQTRFLNSLLLIVKKIVNWVFTHEALKSSYELV